MAGCWDSAWREWAGRGSGALGNGALEPPSLIMPCGCIAYSVAVLLTYGHFIHDHPHDHTIKIRCLATGSYIECSVLGKCDQHL